MSKLTLFLIFAALAAIPPACPPAVRWLPCPPNTEKSEEIEALIAKELYVGAPSSEIEAFFERHDIGYSYNQFGNRYRGIIRNVSSYTFAEQSVVIRVNLDNEKRYLDSEVSDVFTAP